MSRQTVEVDKQLLEKAIAKVEEFEPCKNLDELWKKAALVYNELSKESSITFSVVRLRALAWNIPTKTKPGRIKKSNTTEFEPIDSNSIKKSRSPKLKGFHKCELAIAGFVQQKKEIPRSFQGFVNKFQKNGCRESALVLKCAECANYNVDEINNCELNSCVLYAIRPIFER